MKQKINEVAELLFLVVGIIIVTPCCVGIPIVSYLNDDITLFQFFLCYIVCLVYIILSISLSNCFKSPCNHTYTKGRIEGGFRICDKCFQANDDDVQADIDKL